MVSEIGDSNMSTIFDDVQSGSSTTATPEAYVDKYSDTPILGDNDWWFNHTLGDYVDDKGIGWPPYGIVVAPEGRNTLVWYDASGILHVIDLTAVPHGDEVAISVKNPEYFEDPRYVELWKNILPTTIDIKQILLLAVGLGVVVIFIKRGK
jgi:hypothetical protein